MKKRLLIAGISAFALALGASAPGFAGSVTQTQTDAATVINNTVNDLNSSRSNLLSGSNFNATGIQHVQQNNGDANAISAGSAVAVNVASGTSAQTVGQTVQMGTFLVPLQSRNNLLNDNTPGVNDRTNQIVNSFNSNTGITTVQQNNGDGNVMQVSDAIAANLGPNVGQTGTFNQGVRINGRVLLNRTRDNDTAASGNGLRSNLINPSFQNYSGVLNVQQNNGNGNVMAVGNAVAADIGTSQVSGPLETVNVQLASVNGRVIRNTSTHTGPNLPIFATFERRNTIIGSFQSADGLINVQQNNGDNNFMGIANAVVANIDSDDDIDIVNASTAATVGLVLGNTNTTDFDTDRENRFLSGAFNGAHGIISVQQNNGDNNALMIANAVTMNVRTTQQFGQGLANTGTLALNNATVAGNTAIVNLPGRRNLVPASNFQNVAGILNVQQNNGDNNSMGIAVSVAASLRSPVGGFIGNAVNNATLAALVTGNVSTVNGGILTNSVTGSFANFSGILNLQQNNGNNNAMQSAVSVTANLPNGVIGGGNFLAGL